MTRFPDRLIHGYRGFRSGRFQAERARYEALAETGQSPQIMVIGCVDLRVSPEVIFEAAPGEMLVVRNVAALAPRYEPDASTQHGVSAALEFGVIALGVRDLVVLGHASCGGVRAFADEGQPLSSSDFIGQWMAQIEPAARRLDPPSPETADWLRRLELAAIELSLENLMTFPWIAARVHDGRLALHGAYFGIAEGRLLVRDPLDGAFKPLAEREGDAPA